jgi:hypothetical protein
MVMYGTTFPVRFILIATCIAVASVSTVLADEEQPQHNKKAYLYEWTDTSGSVHITDSLNRVPEQYRDKVRKIESRKGEDGNAPQGQAYTPDSGSGDANAAARSEWQQRIREWKKREADAENRYHDLERKRDELFRAWGSPSMAPPENRIRAGQIEQEMKDAQAEIDEAKNMLNSVIPEEARKAGVPPGWLRE